MITSAHVKAWLETAIARYPDQGLSILPGVKDEVFWPIKGSESREVVVASVVPEMRTRISIVKIASHAAPKNLPAALDEALHTMLDFPPTPRLPEGMDDLDEFRGVLIRNGRYDVGEELPAQLVGAE